VISSSRSSGLRRVAVEKAGVCYIGVGEEGGEPLQLNSVYRIIIQIILLVFVFHLSYHSFFCLIVFLVARVESPV